MKLSKPTIPNKLSIPKLLRDTKDFLQIFCRFCSVFSTRGALLVLDVAVRLGQFVGNL